MFDSEVLKWVRELIHSCLSMNMNPYRSPRLIDNAIYSLALVVISRLIDNVFNFTLPAGLHTISSFVCLRYFFSSFLFLFHGYHGGTNHKKKTGVHQWQYNIFGALNLLNRLVGLGWLYRLSFILNTGLKLDICHDRLAFSSGQVLRFKLQVQTSKPIESLRLIVNGKHCHGDAHDHCQAFSISESLQVLY